MKPNSHTAINDSDHKRLWSKDAALLQARSPCFKALPSALNLLPSYDPRFRFDRHMNGGAQAVAGRKKCGTISGEPNHRGR